MLLPSLETRSSGPVSMMRRPRWVMTSFGKPVSRLLPKGRRGWLLSRKRWVQDVLSNSRLRCSWSRIARENFRSGERSCCGAMPIIRCRIQHCSFHFSGIASIWEISDKICRRRQLFPRRRFRRRLPRRPTPARQSRPLPCRTETDHDTSYRYDPESIRPEINSVSIIDHSDHSIDDQKEFVLLESSYPAPSPRFLGAVVPAAILSLPAAAVRKYRSGISRNADVIWFQFSLCLHLFVPDTDYACDWILVILSVMQTVMQPIMFLSRVRIVAEHNY